MGWLETLVQLMILLVVMLDPATCQLALPGCQEKCGDISIPYPFGIGPKCSLEDAFSVYCPEPNRPVLVWTQILPVLNISLEGYLRVSLKAAYNCDYNRNGTDSFSISFLFSQFNVSETRNKLMAVGCNGDATLGKRSETFQGFSEEYTVRCSTECFEGNVNNGSCIGHGCCEAPVPKGMKGFNLSVSSRPYSFRARNYHPCNYAFLVEEGRYRFVTSDFSASRKIREYPVVLEWWVGQERCNIARQNPKLYACKSKNSFCFEPYGGPGYRCHCTDGYKGHPYIANGCKDIDECTVRSLNNCIKPESCRNLPGNYTCACPKGHSGDGKKNGTGCIAGIIIGLLVLFLGISWVYLALRQRKTNKMKERFFKQNGGILLRQELWKLHGSSQETLVFSADDLKKATENYHESRILGQGGQGTVYKGLLPDNRTVAIKKARIGDCSYVDQFINELIVLSQINHRNVVKLLGCCLETEVPLLVYEFVTNGALFDHMHDPSRPSLLPWETRLKIAVETAAALSYLHSAASIPIIHRDIKSANILLDDTFIAKVSDFGASRLIPADQEQLTTLVRGTLGYLDPEYFQTSRLNEKSDVYSFGVLLLELLTGEKAFTFGRAETERHLVTIFVSAMKENRSAGIFDQRVVSPGNIDQLMGVAYLAMRCVRIKGEARPTMKEVAADLEGLRAM